MKESSKARKDGWISVQISKDESSVIDLRIGRVIIEVQYGFDRLLLADVLPVINTSC
jgi:hypothetical protein